MRESGAAVRVRGSGGQRGPGAGGGREWLLRFFSFL
ncbi:hypothetical protein Pint_29337 [Pistacia integerrima]|uniref:Uncharacterized protein n=1 Tax=Pistacia integerrima TaxID=434235 RepID=A0ACC0WYF7_9ROSI|nr:hypothetical protein Pint_29337 [Pistacia integerrima]